MLRAFARRLRPPAALNLDDYFELLVWATIFALVKDASEPWKEGVGYELGGVHYALVFMSREAAAQLAASEGNPDIVKAKARELLHRLPDGWGLIVDYGSDSELRIVPERLTALNEEFRVKKVSKEATKEWLTGINDLLLRQNIPEELRADRAKEIWASENSFRVLPSSRRARRIDRFFDTSGAVNTREKAARLARRWRKEYATNPYLHHLTSEALRERFVSLTRNLSFSDRKALPHELDDEEWTEPLEHARAESERRGGVSLPSFEPSTEWPRRDKAREAFETYSGRPGRLFKFGSPEHVMPMLSGKIKLFPATSYADPTLRPAQRDDELARSVLLDPNETVFEHVGTNGVRRRLDVIGSIKHIMRSSTNYYVWCTSTAFDPRLFDDFGKDACLVIQDPLAFGTRLYAAVDKVRPGWLGGERLVRYFDPLRTEYQVLATFHKDFRFSYQREYRFVWDPPDPALNLDPIEVDLGNCEDIAAVIRI